MRRDDQAHLGSSWRQGHRRAIVERALHAAFGVRADLIGSTPQSRLHLLQIEQMVGPTSHDYAQLSREHIKKGSRITIQAVQSHEDGGGSKPQVRCTAGDDPDRSSQFPR
jgi:hypothetical protein